jgi:hypothetical protein
MSDMIIPGDFVLDCDENVRIVSSGPDNIMLVEIAHRDWVKDMFEPIELFMRG